MSDQSFAEMLSELTYGFTPVIDKAYRETDYIHIDLSPSNRELSEEAVASSESFSVFLEQYLDRSGMKVAFGGYNETRKLYNRSGLFTGSQDDDLNRNIHLGLDVWAPAGTAVLAVLDGKVHSLRDNANFGDYGPTIILEHFAKKITFYTLYGHLDRKSLEKLSPGQKVRKGEEIAQLGTPEENGDYAPHLHFQIIKDLQGRTGDYPGVSSRKDLDHFLANCPDPDLLLKLPL